MNFRSLISCASVALFLGACGDRALQDASSSGLQAETTDASDTLTASATVTGPPPTASTGEPPPTDSDDGHDGCHEPNVTGYPTGAQCWANADCYYDLCVAYSQAPFDPDASCAVPPSDCRTRFTGRVRWWPWDGVVGETYVRATGAIAASVNPWGANALAEQWVEPGGLFDMTTQTMLEEPLGVVGIAEWPGSSYLYTSVLAEPKDPNTNAYGPGNDWRDMFVIDEESVWIATEILSQDPFGETWNYLPLGELGGVVGIVRDAQTGAPVAGARVQSSTGNSAAVVRYIDFESWEVTTDVTTASGLFAILNPGLGERFEAASPNGVPWSPSVWVMSAQGTVNVIALDI